MEEKTLFHKFVAFSASVHRVTHELTKDAKCDVLTPVQYNILEYIAISQPVTISEISDSQHMCISNTSRELKKLSGKNLIKKIDCIEDRRKQYILLSEEGEIMMNEVFHFIETHFLNRIQNTSKDNLEQIERALDILQEKIYY